MTGRREGRHIPTELPGTMGLAAGRGAMVATRGWFLAMFAVSGFAGLIYESLWSHYLRLFLGHAAYAQTLVLAIFKAARANELTRLGRMSIPAIDFLGGTAREGREAVSRAWLKRSEWTCIAQRLRAYYPDGAEQCLRQLPPAMRSDAQLMRMALSCPARGARLSVDQLYSVAAALLPYVAAHGSRDLRRAMRACHPAASQAAWLDLFAAVDARDARQMAHVAQALLEASEFRPESHADYLLAAAILGRLAQRERGQAQELWCRYCSQVSSDRGNVLPEFLGGHLFPATEN